MLRQRSRRDFSENLTDELTIDSPELKFNNKDMKKSGLSKKSAAIHSAGAEKRDHHEIDEADTRYKTLFEQSADGILIIDCDGRFVEFNEAAHRQLGFSREEFAALKISDIDPVESPQEIQARMTKLLNGEKAEFEVKHRTKEGEIRDVQVITQTIALSRNTVFHSIWHDITERKKVEGLLERAVVKATEEKNKFEAIISAIGDGVSIRDTDFKILFENQKQKETTGSNEGEHCYRAYQNRDEVCEGCLVAMCYKDGNVHKGIQTRRNGKDTAYYEITASPLRDHNGNITAGIEVVRDITERRRTEESLRISEAKLNDAQAIAHVGSWEWDISSGAFYWSDEIYHIYGYEPHEISPNYGLVVNAMHPDSKDAFLRTVDASLKGERPFELDYTFFKKDGSEAVGHLIGRFVRDANSAPGRIYGTVQEITLQKRMEKVLRESEEKFRSIFDNANDGILIAGIPTKKFCGANKTICGMLGYEREELLGLGVEEIYPDRDLSRIIEDFAKLAGGEKTIAENLPVLRKDGTVFYADVSSSVITLEDEQCVIGVFRDITERRQAEERLRASLREKEILLKEVHHRVKNNLQVVASMLQLQSAYITDEDAKRSFEESQQRVESMSIIHEKLYQSKDLARIDFREYMESVVSNLITLNSPPNEEVKITLDIEGISLDINRSIPCGLILNELITNSLRHAFTDGREGEIVIGMHYHGGGRIRLTVSDNGIGFPDGVDFRKTKSLGMQLVMALVKQIDGAIDMEACTGTCFRIAFQT